MDIKANLYKQQALNNLHSMKSTLMHRWSFQFISNSNNEDIEDDEEYDQSIMELSHSLTLNEEAYNQIPVEKRPVFVFEWLRFLDKVLIAAQKTDIKECQKKLVEQLTTHMQNSPGPPTRKLIARCLALLFSVGDTFLLFETVNKCNDILRNKDDSPSFLSTKLAAVNVVGAMYEQLGRMMGRSYEETVQILLKSLRNAESQMRIEIIVTLEKICAGMGKAISNVHKEIYKSVRVCLLDRVMSVRVAASNCLLEMLNHAPFLYTTELESMSSQCFRAFEGSNYEVRVAVAKLLGNLIAQTQLCQQTTGKNGQSIQSTANNKVRPTSLDEALGFLMSGFLRGGGSFLKGTGEMIKGSSGSNREVRIGVTHGYVIFAHTMGSVWLERNLQTFLIHVLDLVANPKAASSHVDAVYSRKCINFILRSVVGKIIGEKAQSSTCKELIHIIAKQMNSIDFNPENAKDANQETLFSQHLLVCALQELGSLTIGLGTTAQNLLSDQSLNFIDAVCAVLVHPCSAARLAAAWCLRCICVAVPSQITPLIDRCLDAIEKMRSSPDAISGYSGALAAVVGSVRYSPLGIPHTKGKIIFNTAEELLRTASQNSRLSLNRTQSGWLLIGAIMTLGVPVVKGLLPRMLLLWRNAFPRSTKELESEKARGDAFTWQVTLEGRAGALSVMHSFLTHCGELVTDDITRRLLTPIESALAMLINITQILKNYGQHLKAPAAMVRLRLYETLTLLPSTALESSYTHLLRMLVSEFTLTENQANTTTSLLRDMCNAEDSIILGTWLEETDHRYIEDQLQPISASGSGALEHDPCCLYRPLQKSKNETSPGPLPLGVSVIDMSAMLFGNVFSYVSNKHRLQMLEHFSECIKHAKSQRQEAVQMNIFTALLCGLKGLTESKCSIGGDDVKKSATNLIINGLISPNPILRCAAGETLGRIAQVVGDSRFTAELAQTSFDRLKSARDVVTRTGHSLALGCLHRCVGGMGSSQHLNTSVSILLALAQDSSSPVVQVWSLYALSMIADSGGPMFRGYIEPALSMGLKLLLTVPQSNVDVHQCVGRVLSALITTIGPELQGNETSICSLRSNILCACAIMQAHSDPLVQAEAVGCLQQLHLFAPKFVNLSSLVPTLCRTLSSNYLILRKAAISCLRQLTTREAREVTEHALSIFTDDDGLLSEYGLMGMLFAMLDTETDQEMIKNIHDTIVSMLQMLAADNLSHWLSMCKRVLTVASESDNATNELQIGDNDGGDEDEDDNDNAEFHAEEPTQTHPAVQPRWKTRVFAAECVRRIIVSCEQGSSKHFDLVAAKDLNSRGDFLVLHLSDLIRMSFMAATSDSDQLRLEGLKTLQEIVDKFARVPEPEFPGHLLLEQFQAQVGAALRPAFASETPSHVTAAACEVCSAWIGSGVARDLNDLRRVHQLLVQSLTKLQTKTNSTQLYNESMATLEKLSILKAWAQVYIIAMISNGSSPTQKCLRKLKSVQNSFSAPSDDEIFEDYEPRGESLLSLVQPELENLSRHWLAALRDYALLSLPSEYSSQLPHDGGAFYTPDTINSSKPHYQSSWPQILIASSLWLNSGGFESGLNMPTTDHTETRTQTITHGSLSADRFYLIFGICMESLCSTRSNEKLDCVIACLTALYTIFDSKWSRDTMAGTKELLIELSNVLYRQILTRDSLEVQLLSVEIMKQSIAIARDSINVNNDPNGNNVDNNEENVVKNDCEDLSDPTKSHVYAVLEVIVCLLARHCPELNPSQTTRLTFEKPQNMSTNGNYRLNDDNNMIVGLTLNSMEDLPSLCTPEGAVKILPTILYLTTGVIQEMATKSCHDTAVLANCGAIQAALHLLKAMTVHKYASDEKSADDWRKYLESALAKIIDLTKTGSNDEKKLDEVTMMLAIAVFILHAPKVVMMPTFQYPSINLFRQCFQSDSNIVRLKCVQTAKSIFLNADLKVATPYIHSLAPRIIEHLFDDATKCPKDDVELTLIQESITTVDCLITLAEPQNRIQMLTLLVPILIRFLLEPTQMKNSSKFSIQLHEHALMWLMKIGPKYPQEFKSLMSQAPELKMKLETTVRNQQQAADMQKAASETTESNKAIVQPQQPTIKLKTKFDF